MRNWQVVASFLRDLFHDGLKIVSVLAPVSSLSLTAAKALDIDVRLRDFSYAWAMLPLLAWILIAYGRRRAESHLLVQQLEPQFRLAFDRLSDDYVTPLVDGKFIHICAINDRKFNLTNVHARIMKVEREVGGEFGRTHFFNPLSLGWATVPFLPQNFNYKYGAADLIPGGNFIDVCVARESDPQTVDGRRGFRLEIDPGHGDVRWFFEPGRYRLTIQVSGAVGSPQTIKLMVKWSGNPRELEVSEDIPIPVN